MVRLIAVSSVLMVAFAGPARGEDPAPDVALKQKGLRRSGQIFVLPAESELARRLGALRVLGRELALVIGQQHAAEAQAETNKQLIVTYTQQRRVLREQLQVANSVDEHNRIVNMLNELGDRVTLLAEGGANPKAVKELTETATRRREDYVQGLLDLRQLIDQTNKQYADLGKDDEVRSALSALNAKTKSPLKLGPTRAYTTNVKTFERLESALLTETIDLRKDNGVFWVDAVLNGKVSKPMIFDTGASLVSLPAELASQLDLKPSADQPVVRLQTADGTIVEGKLMTLASVRVGKFTVENVQCAVLPPSVKDAPPLLGGSFLKNFASKFSPGTGQLTLSKVTMPGAEKPTSRSGASKRR